MQPRQQRILVLGVGNILFTDEGIGVRVIEYLERNYELSDNVTLYDGGTLGMRLMEPIMNCDRLIVVDAVLGDGPPGTLYRLTGDGLRRSLAFRNSLHQTDLVDTLTYCGMVGHRPETVVVGIEPEDYLSMAVSLSPTIAGCLETITEAVAEEVRSLGGTLTRKTHFMRESKCALPSP